MTKIKSLSLLVLCTLMACGGKPDTLFESMSPASTGVNFKNILRETDDFHVLKYGYFYNGGGVAVGDVNNDGLADIYFTGNLVGSRLYLNKGNWKFEEVAEKAGVFADGLWNTGVTMADVNGDGWLDMYVCRSAAAHPMRRENLLFINDGPQEEEGEVHFTEMGVLLGVADQGYGTQAAFFDYDRDGDLDLYVLNHSVQDYAGFSRLMPEDREKKNAFYGDKLYRNELIPAPDIPPGGGFSDVTQESGILTNVLGFGLGIAIADLNRDGWPDIYVSNDYNENDYFYLNQQDGTFQEQISGYFDHVSMFSMGSDIADINNDGLPDLMTLDMLPEDNYRLKMTSGPDHYDKYQRLVGAGFHHQTMRNMLQLNQGNGAFAEVGQLAGISNTDWSWSALFADFDLDGWEDLFVSNGYERDYTNMDFLTYAANEKIRLDKMKKDEAVTTLLAEMPSIRVPNYLYKNNGDLSFTKMTDAWGLSEIHQSNGAAYGDLDGDGDLDLVVNNINEPASLYQNHAEKFSPHHYLRVQLKGAGKNAAGIGAEVCLFRGEKLNCQTLMPTRGFQSAVEPILTFGLGTDTLVDRIEIRWPDGGFQTLGRTQANQLLLIVQDSSAQPAGPAPARPAIFSASKQQPDFAHSENDFSDFDREPLLPNLLSTQGPRLAQGDVNGDGREDLFVGGAKGQPGAVFLQTGDMNFTATGQPDLAADAGAEDLGAALFDADGDGDLDLYVVSGGNEFAENDPALQDRLYLNNGRGTFTKATASLPEMLTSGSCVAPTDWDGDGDMDLFVGGRLVPGKYPQAPRSYFLKNDGRGNFSDATADIAPALERIGMVSSAVWTRLDEDELPDLVLVGEWMPITMWYSATGALREVAGSSGWWNTLTVADMDRDGDMDFLLGNLGKNSQVKVSPEEPAHLYVCDFDKNGTDDPIMTYFLDGASYPMPSRDDLLKQLPYLKGKYTSYEDYANQTIGDVFDAAELAGASRLEAVQFSSIYLENTGQGQFSVHTLPIEAQVAPVYAIAIEDVNGDGHLDAVLAGNLSGTRVKFGRYDANHGVLLLGDGKGNFRAETQVASGFHLRGDVRDMAVLTQADGRQLWLFARNNQPLESYTLLPTATHP